MVLVFRYHLNEDTENNNQITKLKRKKKKGEQKGGKQTMYVILFKHSLNRP